MSVDPSRSSFIDSLVNTNRKDATEKKATQTPQELELQNAKGEEQAALRPLGVAAAASDVSSAQNIPSQPDTILPSGEGTKTPQLPMSQQQIIDASEVSIKSTKGINLIAIMANVMILQAKSNEDFFSSNWKLASASMSMESQLAVVNAKATYEAGMAKANATQAQADGSLTSGIISIVSFGAAVVLGGVMTALAPEEDAATSAAEDSGTNIEQQTVDDAEDSGEVEGETEDAIDGVGDLDGESSTDTNETEETQTTREQTKAKSQESKETSKTNAETNKEAGENVLSKLKQGAKKSSRIFKAMNNVMQVGMTVSMASQGTTGLTNSIYQTRQAVYEKQGASWEAIVSMGNTEVQIMGQSFGRAESMSQQAQQNINTALQILEGIVQAVTQTVNSGFQSV